MITAVKKCRICGREYEACRSANRAANVFRWQEVACSPECGTVYLEKINASRNTVNVQKKSKHKREISPPVIEATEETVIETVTENSDDDTGMILESL